MTDPAPDPTLGAPTPGAGDPARSGDDVAEAVEVAERGSSVQEVHDRPEAARSGAAPVEQAGGDPEMTEGQVVLGDAEPVDDDEASAAGGPAQG